MMKKLLALLAITAAVTTGGCGNAPASPGGEKPVTIGLLRLTSSAPVFIALDKGFFKEENLDVKPVWFGAAQPISVAAASNTIDIGATGLTASIYNMAAAGRPVIITADKGQEHQGFRSSSLIVRKDAGIDDVEDLRGKTFGMTTAGSSFQYMMGNILDAEGIPQEEVEFLPLRSLGSVMAAVKTGKADSAVVNEPNGTKSERAGWGKVVTSVGDVIQYQTSAIFYSPSFASDYDQGVRFMKAYIRACRWYYDNVLTNKDHDSPEFKEGISIISRYTKAPEKDIILGLPWLDRDGRLLDGDIEKQIQWYQDRHLVRGNVPPMTNLSYWEEAERELS